MSLPRITQTGASEYVINVQREEIETYIFGEHDIKITCSKDEELQAWERLRIKGGADDDGYIYFLEAHPEDVGLPSFIWLTKEEAFQLDKQLREEKEKF